MEENWWSWFALVASILCISLLDGSMYSNGIFYKKIAEALNLSEFWVKLAGSIEVAISSFVAIAAAKLTDKYGLRYVADCSGRGNHRRDRLVLGLQGN